MHSGALKFILGIYIINFKNLPLHFNVYLERVMWAPRSAQEPSPAGGISASTLRLVMWTVNLTFLNWGLPLHATGDFSDHQTVIQAPRSSCAHLPFHQVSGVSCFYPGAWHKRLLRWLNVSMLLRRLNVWHTAQGCLFNFHVRKKLPLGTVCCSVLCK